MATETTARSLRKRIEERRRRVIGLLRAIDHVGITLDELPPSTMNQIAARDADCALFLVQLAAAQPQTPVASQCVDLVSEVEQKLDALEEKLLSKPVAADRSAVRQAHPVGMLTVDDDDIYDGLPRPRRR